MKMLLSLSVIATLTWALSATARQPTYTQEHNADGTVTTKDSNSSAVIHDSTREGGQQTKQDLENQGFEVHARRHLTICDGIYENCPPPQKKSVCQVEPVCEGLRNQCYYVTLCVPMNENY